MLRRLTRKALENLPEITQHTLQVPLKSTNQKYYDEHFNNFLNSLKDRKSLAQQREQSICTCPQTEGDM